MASEILTAPQILSEEHDTKRRSPLLIPCEVCGKGVTSGGAGRKQHMKTHTRPTVPDQAARVRFEKLFTVSQNGCWQWGAVSANSPYGSFYFAGRNYMAFIFSWWLYRGELVKTPPLELDHLCRNKGCVNPDHLEPVTRSENAKRAAKSHCPQGHLYTPETTFYVEGTRRCKTCNRIRNEKYHAENREKLNAKRKALYHRTKHTIGRANRGD